MKLKSNQIGTFILFCADYFDVKVDDVLVKNRTPQASVAKHFIRYALTKYTDLPHQKIGDIVGRVDRTSVINSIKFVNEESHTETKQILEKIEEIAWEVSKMNEMQRLNFIDNYSKKDMSFIEFKYCDNPTHFGIFSLTMVPFFD